MAKRDLTDKFRAWKLESGRKPKTLAPTDLVLGEEGIGLQATGLRQSEAPAWVETVENIKKDIELAKEKMKTLEQLHKDRLKVIYNEKDEKAKDESIGIVVGAITQLLKRAENGVKRVAHIGNGEGVVLAQEERTTRLNVMRALANELQGLGRQFKQAQKDFGNKLKGQEEGGGALSVFDAATKNAPDFDTLIDQGLSGAEVQQIAQLKQWDEERTKQIVQIAQSVNELAQVFKELNVLVIEQGTVMDRIDYQIEQTLVKVQGGRKYLEEGEKFSRNSRSLKCIACLLLIVIILIVILALQKSGNNNNSK